MLLFSHAEVHYQLEQSMFPRVGDMCADVPPGRCSVRCPAQARSYPSPRRAGILEHEGRRRPGAVGSAARTPGLRQAVADP